jgi:hypothetical protein
MSADRSPSTVLRESARRLLKELRSADPAISAPAARRFLRLRSFADRSVATLLDDRDHVRLKHALAVVAEEHGHDSWTALKAAADSRPVSAAPDDGPPMYERGLGGLLNRWFASYSEARASLADHGGYLLPYRTQFFVCESEGVRALGIDPDDPDWERIGRDWVRPGDLDAWRRLRDRRREAIERSRA